MHRRILLKNAALGAAVVFPAGRGGGAPPDQPPGPAPTGKGNLSGGFGDDFPLNELSVPELQAKMESGESNARTLTELYMDRIQALDRAGPVLRAVIEVNPEALAMAEAMDAERKAGRIRGPLHGIPVLIKDNISTGDQMMTTAGSLALEGYRAARDAVIVSKLRAAGAVLLGKTNLSEWANFRSTRSCSGWSSRGGQTKNPAVLDRSPSGSSSGSAAAVAANFCALAIGTETNGSIMAPASSCGIVGFKPTVGLWSRTGIIPISSTQDTAGPMTRTVRDAAVLLGALTGMDAADPATLRSEGKILGDYTAGLDAGALRGRRIGIEKSGLKGHEGVVALYQEAIRILNQAGAETVEVELVDRMGPLGRAESLVLQYEFKAGVNAWLAGAHARVKDLAGVIAFNRAEEAAVMPFFKQELLEKSEARGGLDSAEYQEALATVLSSRRIIDSLMEQYRLEAVCSPSMGPAVCIDPVHGDGEAGFYFGSPAAMAGYPHITVPMGQVHGLPVGFSFMAGAWQDSLVLGLAYAWEQISRKRRPPRFLTTAD